VLERVGGVSDYLVTFAREPFVWSPAQVYPERIGDLNLLVREVMLKGGDRGSD